MPSTTEKKTPRTRLSWDDNDKEEEENICQSCKTHLDDCHFSLVFSLSLVSCHSTVQIPTWEVDPMWMEGEILSRSNVSLFITVCHSWYQQLTNGCSRRGSNGGVLLLLLCSASRAAELVALVLCSASWQLPSYVRFPRLTWRAVELLQ